MKIGGNFLEKYDLNKDTIKTDSKDKGLFGNIFLEKNLNTSESLYDGNSNNILNSIKDKAQNYKDSRDIKKKDRNRVMEQPEDNAVIKEKNAEPEKIKDSEKVEDIKVEDEITQEEVDKTKLAGIYGEIANLLGITVEEVQIALENLEIPEETLLTLDGVRNAIMSLSGLSDTTELINIEGIKDFFEVVENIVNLTNEEVESFLSENPNFLADFEEALKVNEEISLEEVDNEVLQKTDVSQAQNSDVEVENQQNDINQKTIINQQLQGTENSEEVEGNTNKVLEVMEEINQEAINLEVKAQSVEAQSQAQALSGGSNESNSNANTNTSDNNLMNNIMFGQDAKGQVNTFNSIVNARMNSNANMNNTDVINQIIEKMKFNITGDTSEVRITLRPEHLGDVTLKIATHNGVVTAEFMAESEQVRALIEANFQDLQETLRQKGISVEQFTTSLLDSNKDEETGRRNNENGDSKNKSSNFYDDEEVEETLEKEIKVSNYDYKV